MKKVYLILLISLFCVDINAEVTTDVESEIYG